MVWLSGSLVLASLLHLSAAELSGRTGPTTSREAKIATKVCNILDHGGVASRTADNGPAIAAAWAACRDGGEVYIPAGEYGLDTWVVLNKGQHVSLNIEGTIFRTGTTEGNMFLIRDSDDVEIYSSTGLGAIQGFGYEFHKDGKYGPRIMRLHNCTHFSVHDFVLVDSPAFHLTVESSSDGEVYNLVIHGGNEGGLDGIDVWGSNIWIHDIEVSNKDECVTVKSPADHILVESVHCNWSGGCAMGSLSTGTNISNIDYRNIYTHHSNQLYMFKSRGGSGTVSSVTLDNFIGHNNAYGFDVDTNWLRQSVGAGAGVSYANINVTNWKGSSRDDMQRAAVRVLCPAHVPCTNIEIHNVDIRNQNGSPAVHVCDHAFGAGSCLTNELMEANSEGPVTKTFPQTRLDTDMSTDAAPDFVQPMLPNELKAPWNVSEPIPIPQMPALFFPGIKPKSDVLARAHLQSKGTSV
ncbi:hypothetical protein E4U46_002628 [Claviceps purpurea]|nr:hypothetical protein E4U12_006140 [Claviceps purpurea]KAG6289358.1 hypothetical protein E4U46_002628 [Claviceps purpurea]